MPLRFLSTILNRKPLIIGHRGASAVAPENTLASFARAMEEGADGVELDVRLASDGIPVVIHDPTLHRTGLCEGLVARMTARELSRKDVGAWFNRKKPWLALDQYAREGVPILAEVFSFFAAYSANEGALIYVELKTDFAEKSAAELVRSVVRLINDHRLRERVVVVSFNLSAIAEVRRLNPAIRTGALFEPKTDPARLLRKQKMIAAAADCGAEEILLHRSIAGARAVTLAAKSKLRPVVWTVDDPRWMRRASSLGIHAVITNDPAAMCQSSMTQASPP